MVNYAILGLGMMGEAILYDLLEYDNNCFVHGFEINDNRRKHLENKFIKYKERFVTYHLELDLKSLVENNPLIETLNKLDISVVFGAIDYKYNLYLTQICIQSKVHFLDLGGNPNIVKSQKVLNEEARESNITIIPDCGLAPGMANVIATHGMNKFDELIECHIRVGGLPQEPKTILKYQQVFAIRGLTNEYLEDAIVIRNGKIKMIPSLTELEELSFGKSYTKLEAFQTAGGSSSLPLLFEGKIEELTYKTIRYPGHCKFFQFLKEFELFTSDPYPNNPEINARKVVEYYLQKNLPKNQPDVVLVRISIKGKIQGKESTLVYELIDLANKKTGYSAMARTTAYPASIIGQMIARSIITTKGVVTGELVIPEEEFMNELEKRNIIFSIK